MSSRVLSSTSMVTGTCDRLAVAS